MLYNWKGPKHKNSYETVVGNRNYVLYWEFTYSSVFDVSGAEDLYPVSENVHYISINEIILKWNKKVYNSI